MKTFKQFLAERTQEDPRQQVQQRFGELPNFINQPWMTPENKPYSYQTQQQGQMDLWMAHTQAQQMNKKAGGAVAVYHSISPKGKYGLPETLKHLTSKTTEELSVSVQKGLWNTILLIEGKAPLLLYYDKDVSTNRTPQKQLVPIRASIPSSSSHYDEAVIRLSDVTWTTLYVDDSHPDIQALGGINEIANVAKQYNLRVARSQDASPTSMVGKANLRQQTYGTLLKDT